MKNPFKQAWHWLSGAEYTIVATGMAVAGVATFGLSEAVRSDMSQNLPSPAAIADAPAESGYTLAEMNELITQASLQKEAIATLESRVRTSYREELGGVLESGLTSENTTLVGEIGTRNYLLTAQRAQFAHEIVYSGQITEAQAESLMESFNQNVGLVPMEYRFAPQLRDECNASMPDGAPLEAITLCTTIKASEETGNSMLAGIGGAFGLAGLTLAGGLAAGNVRRRRFWREQDEKQAARNAQEAPADRKEPPKPGLNL